MNVYLVTLFSEANPEQFAGHFLQFPSGVELAYAIKVEREESSGDRAEGLTVLADGARSARQEGDVLAGGIKIGRVKVDVIRVFNRHLPAVLPFCRLAA